MLDLELSLLLWLCLRNLSREEVCGGEEKGGRGDIYTYISWEARAGKGPSSYSKGRSQGRHFCGDGARVKKAHGKRKRQTAWRTWGDMEDHEQAVRECRKQSHLLGHR
jgi:hypothetical protein